jgi:hypothetical protein
MEKADLSTCAENLSLLDMAPLALHILGIAAPGWMDGSAQPYDQMMAMPDDLARVSEKPYNSQQEALLRRRLANLGYLP